MHSTYSGTHTTLVKLPFKISKITFVLSGAVLGILFIVIILGADLFYNGLPFDFNSIGLIYKKSIGSWFLLGLPPLFASMCYNIATIVERHERIVLTNSKEQSEQFSILGELISQLEKQDFNVAVSASLKDREVARQLNVFKEKLISEKVESEKRSWENQGLAKFAELLRQSADTDRLAIDVLQYLVKYLKCNQGSLFLLNEEQEMLELKACYAFDKRKFLHATLPVGQGLVGQCFLEKEPITLFDVPQDYIKITSGLGLANPRCIVLVPLKNNDKVAGVLEVASFNRLEKHQISFLEKCCEAFASVVQSQRVNENVKNLLQQSQEQTEQLRSQDEEMRQNLEELQTIQEQISRQLEENKKVTSLLEARERVLAHTTILSESDLFGTITYVNDKFVHVSGYSREELLGKPHKIVRHPEMPPQVFKVMWATIKSGKTFRGIVKNRRKNGGHYWVDATIVPILENGKIIKYIGARYHIEDNEVAERMFEAQMLALSVNNNIAVMN